MRRPLAPAVAAALLTTGPAVAGTSLPAAVRSWFETDRSIACVTPDGRDRRCPLSATEHIGVHRDPGNTCAMAFVSYLTDAGAVGNAVRVAAAVFRRDAGGWTLVRTLPGARAEPSGPVSFGRGLARYETAVPHADDPRCCPKGRATHRVAIP